MWKSSGRIYSMSWYRKRCNGLDGGKQDDLTIDQAASWSLIGVLSLADAFTVSCPVPKSQMTSFPTQVASPTTTKPIITMIPMQSKLSDIENMGVPDERRCMVKIVHLVGGGRKFQCRTVCA